MSAPAASGLHTIDEEITDRELEVSGAIPHWLTGSYFLNGPGKFSVGTREVNHWFDGLAMLRRFRITDGDVIYTNRFLRSQEFTHVQEHGDLKHAQFGTNNDKSIVDRLRALVDPSLTDNGVVTLGTFGDRLVAVTETPKMVVVDPETLQANGTVTFDDDVDVQWSLAHTHYDPDNEALLNLGFRVGRRDEYVLTKRPVDTRRRKEIGAVETDRLAYVHTFGLTDRYVVIVESPFRLQFMRLFRDLPFVDRFQWEADRPTRFLIVDRYTGELIAAPETEPFITYHHANAYEQGDDLVVDLVAFDDAWAIEGLYLNRTRSDTDPFPVGELRRYEMSLQATGVQVESETLHPGPVSFPTFNYTGYNGSQHRYIYCAAHGERPSTTLTDRVVKIDTETEKAKTFTADDAYLSEPLFVPAPGSDSEDHGVLLTVGVDPAGERSQLFILDARELKIAARAEIPHCLPYGFHGQFYRTINPPDPVRSMA